MQLDELPDCWTAKPLRDCVAPKELWNLRRKPRQRIRYVELAGIDNERGVIANSSDIEAAKAPSRAKKVIRAGDVIFATTRPRRPAGCDAREAGRIAPVAAGSGSGVGSFHARVAGQSLSGRVVSAPQIESQRDSVLQPRVDRAAGYPGTHAKESLNPNGIAASSSHRFDATPLGLMEISIRVPRVARASQPWAERRCPVGTIPLRRRATLVARLDALRGKLDELQRLQREVETELASFTPALLAKAFRGARKVRCRDYSTRRLNRRSRRKSKAGFWE